MPGPKLWGSRKRNSESEVRMPRPSRIWLALFIAAAAVFAQTASEKPSTDVRRVGVRLKCKCGCGDSVASCSMLECGFSKPAKDRIARMQAVGMSDKQIIDAFIRDNGPDIFLS